MQDPTPLPPVPSDTSLPLPTSEPSSTTFFTAGNNIWMETAKSFFSTWKGDRFKSVRPIGEFFDRERVSIPSFQSIPARLKSNLVYFQSNYFVLFLVLCVYSALTEPAFLLGVVFVGAAWIYNLKFRSSPIVIRNQEVPERVISFALLLISLFVLYLTSPNLGSLVQWLFVATSVCILLHALFYTPQPVDEFGFGLSPETSTQSFSQTTFNNV